MACGAKDLAVRPAVEQAVELTVEGSRSGGCSRAMIMQIATVLLIAGVCRQRYQEVYVPKWMGDSAPSVGAPTGKPTG